MFYQPFFSGRENNPSTSNTSFLDKGIRIDKVPKKTGAQFTSQLDRKQPGF